MPAPAKRAAALPLSPEPQHGVPDGRHIAKIHLTATAPNGDVLDVVTFTNARCGITRNGQPIPDMEWDVEQMADCTAALKRLAALGGHTPP